MNPRIWPGAAYPLGATWTGEGANFAVFSEQATRVVLELFRERYDATPFASVDLARERPGNVWKAFLPDARPGHLYGYRVHGAYDPEGGQRFNHHKLLVDPYAKAVSGPLRWDDSVYGYTIGDAKADLSFDTRDSAAFVPKSIVVDTTYPWGDDRPPHTPWNNTVIYEASVRGLTMLHPDVPEHLRASATEGLWQGRVGVSEHLGSDTFLHVATDHGTLNIRAGGDVGFYHGDTVWLTPDSAHLHKFGADGLAIR